MVNLMKWAPIGGSTNGTREMFIRRMQEEAVAVYFRL